MGVGGRGDHDRRRRGRGRSGRAAGRDDLDLRRRLLDPRQHGLPVAAVPDRGDRAGRAPRSVPVAPELPRTRRPPHRGLRAPVRDRAARRADACPHSSATRACGGARPCRSATDGGAHRPGQPLRRGARHRRPAGRAAALAGATDRAVEPLGAGALDPDRDARARETSSSPVAWPTCARRSASTSGRRSRANPRSR